jgi:hypothetical protein
METLDNRYMSTIITIVNITNFIFTTSTNSLLVLHAILSSSEPIRFSNKSLYPHYSKRIKKQSSFQKKRKDMAEVFEFGFEYLN